MSAQIARVDRGNKCGGSSGNAFGIDSPDESGSHRYIPVFRCFLAGLIIALWLAMAPWAWAGSPPPVAACAIAGSASLVGSTGALQDQSSTLTPEQVLQLPAAVFNPVVPGLYLGNGKSVWWLRIDLRNTSPEACERWLVVGPARGGNVQVYVPAGAGWQHMVAGTAYPFAEWALPERRLAFPLQLQPGTTTVLAQVINTGQALTFTPQLWTPQAFLRSLNEQALTDGLIGGSVMLLALVSLVLSILYRRPPLLYMALAAGLYVVHVALFKNYLFMYAWPGWPELNNWARYFFISMHLTALFAYLYTAVRIHRLRHWIRRVFYWALTGFVLAGLFGAFIPQAGLVSMAIIAGYEGLIWILTGVAAYNRISGRDRRWFPPLLMAAICYQSTAVLGQLVGIDLKFWEPEYIAAPMTLALGVFLMGTLFSQARKARRAELRTQTALNKRRTTETKRLERTVAQRTGELERALWTRRRLLGRISHDLGSPLVSTLDSVRLWRAGDTQHDYPQLIERRTRQQMDMVAELLEFSRTEAAEMEPQPIAGYLFAFLNEIAEQSSVAATQRGNRLLPDFADNLPPLVSVDFYYLQRVLTNLLDNAIKFTDHGTIRFSVRTLMAQTTGKVRLHFIVDDDGPGMATSDRERLRRPFERGNNAAQRDGHGLGLAIVTQLLERMGGELQIETSPGGGSRVHFELDVARAAESDLDPALKEGDTIDIDGAERVIVVVDDEPTQRDLTCDLLDGYGFDSVAVADGQAALAVLKSRTADLVLTDQYMAGLDGWGLLHGIRNRHPDLPVLLYSSGPPQPPAGMASAFDATLLKPGDSGTLLRQIESLLDRASPAPCRAATS